ncbi:dehydrogenase [Nocardia stercoris]|uniref:Dehydrogenase n=1 Tax=Nocardia stercoris TaxID=2483361 RepID=A0A3M2LH12_9NOCA|nr:dehydrogenase [Nocardia stercoris]
MRVGLIGVGRIGAIHAATLRDLGASVLIADADAARAAAVATELGVDRAADTDTLFTAGVDAVVIAAATDSHPGLILRSVRAGIPVFCEKPVAVDLAGTRAVVAELAQSPVPVQIGFQRRFDPGYRAARDLVRTGALGRIHTVRATTLDPAPPPAHYVSRSGGLFRDCGVHDFDIVRWVSGREVREVMAFGSDCGAEYIRAAGDLDTASVLLRLDDETLVTVSLTRHNGPGYDVRLELLGTTGNATVGLDRHTPLHPAQPDDEIPSATPYSSFLQRFERAYHDELAAFLDVAKGNTGNPCPPTEALAAFTVAEACERSARERRVVTTDECRAMRQPPSTATHNRPVW